MKKWVEAYIMNFIMSVYIYKSSAPLTYSSVCINIFFKGDLILFLCKRIKLQERFHNYYLCRLAEPWSRLRSDRKWESGKSGWQITKEATPGFGRRRRESEPAAGGNSGKHLASVVIAMCRHGSGWQPSSTRVKSNRTDFQMQPYSVLEAKHISQITKNKKLRAIPAHLLLSLPFPWQRFTCSNFISITFFFQIPKSRDYFHLIIIFPFASFRPAPYLALIPCVKKGG